ncbi:MAG TPA: alcohol dehydrogenase catalytic domain-containing protein [Bryobacteraceae bacterium]|nr:alcohol dehydrogenase catalytic domain-containing protein [Bryobacteraceae bacterium]
MKADGMLAVHLHSGAISVQQAAIPSRLPGYALIRLLTAGICNTDLELQRGYYGFTGRPGHEFVGVVVESDTGSLAGARVAGDINLACGKCEFCAVGLGRHCSNRTVLGIVRHPGAFAEYLTLPDVNLHVLPDSISNKEAVFIEPLAAACEILDQVVIPQNAPAAVLGDGKLGLLIAQVLHAHGAKVTLYGRHPEKLRIAEGTGVQTSLARDLPRESFPYVVESTGSAEGLQQAIGMTRPRGTVVMKSTVHGNVSFDAAPAIVNEITLVGSRCGRFEPAIELLRTRKLDVLSMLSAEFPLSEAPEAFAEAGRRGVLKVLLQN